MAVKTQPAKLYSERIEVEIPRRIANFLRERLETDKRDMDMVRGIVGFSREKLGTEKAKKLLCKYFKEAEDDLYLKSLFDDDVIHALKRSLDYSRESIKYSYGELGTDVEVMALLEKMKLTNPEHGFVEIRSIQEFESEFKYQLLFIELLNDQSILTYVDYGMAKLKLRTIKHHLSLCGASMVFDFLKTAREIVKFRENVRRHGLLERNAAHLDRLLAILDRLVLDDMGFVLGGPWVDIKERLEKMDEIKWINLQNLQLHAVSEYVAKRFFKNSKVH